MPDLKAVRVGSARVYILNAGDMRLRLAEEMAVPESEWRPQYADTFDQPALFPSLSVFVQDGDVKVLVDANDYRATVAPDNPYAIPGYTPPPPIPDQLADLGVTSEDITDVVITHTHWDHFAGTTSPASSGHEPTFPRARYYLGAADWEDAEMQAALADESSLEARTLGTLYRRGALHLVEQRQPISTAIEIIPAPGETKGHQIVRIHSGGETLYVVGDLFHHDVEVEHPEWMVTWADAESMIETRRWLLEDALAENAYIVAAHIATLGRIERTDHGLRWSEETVS
jgi:glyoxylase-like metal-dependent hydrolase (beta-lactamase superfamily II)